MARTKRDVVATLDVLTDGSEHTGDGTVFLTLRKTGSCDDEDPPLSRYALSGLGDGTARLCADQRFKLACTRAAMCGQVDGLASLFLSCHAAGSPSLHVVTADAAIDVEAIAGCVLGRNRGMDIRTCGIPEREGDTIWWNVYSDEFVSIHAGRLNDQSVTFLYTVHSGNSSFTLAMAPPRHSDILGWYEEISNLSLPCGVGRSEKTITIDYILALGCKLSEPFDGSDLPPLITSRPQNSRQDPGILIKSQKAMQELHRFLPEAFPLASTTFFDGLPVLPTTHSFADGPLVLKSCTSVVLRPKEVTIWNRMETIWQRQSSDKWAATTESLKNIIKTKPDAACNKDIDVADSDEIDLGDSDEENKKDERIENGNEDAAEPRSGAFGANPLTSVVLKSVSEISIPHLIVLGTGCASPSAIRGSSGYILAFPSADGSSDCDLFLLDCGEGATTMLSRIAGKLDSKCQIRGIWISHAHLDHFGGMAQMIRFINERQASMSAPTCDACSSKRIRRTNEPVWVMAPSKVLRYADTVLRSTRGVCRKTKRQLFYPMTHNDRFVPPGPWSLFRNIPVEHSCGMPCFGLLLRWRQSGSNNVHLCYSGDTRPCRRLVRVCSEIRSPDPRSPFYLLHEATFLDEDASQAASKKHSTVLEAVRVAKDIPATHVLLTHFSQRYASLGDDATNNVDGIPFGMAMDGLWLPLNG